MVEVTEELLVQQVSFISEFNIVTGEFGTLVLCLDSDFIIYQNVLGPHDEGG